MSIVLDDCQIAPGVLVDKGDITEPLYGLKSVIGAPGTITDHHMENGVEWEPGDCEMAETYCASCTFPGDDKVYHDQAGLEKAVPFTVYGSFKCSGPGYTPEQIIARARENLERGQWRRIEREFWTGVLPSLSAVTNLTPALGATCLVDGVAILEDYLGENVPSLGIIHAPRGVVTRLATANVLPTSRESQIRTHLGTLVAAGGGYTHVGPLGGPAVPGEAWMYATGSVRMWWGSIFDAPGVGDKASVVNRANNDLQAVAERPIIIGYECSVAAVRVEIAC